MNQYTVVEHTTEENQTLHMIAETGRDYYLQTKTIWFVLNDQGDIRGSYKHLITAVRSVAIATERLVVSQARIDSLRASIHEYRMHQLQLNEDQPAC